MDNELIDVATILGELLSVKALTVTTAESCTAGWVGTALAAVSNSSRFYSSGFINYSDASKQRVLRVSPQTIACHSAVSEAVVIEMACGAKALSGDPIGMAVSGYAGPDGGDDGTPAGTVWFGWCLADDSVCTSQKWFSGSSEEVVRKAALYSIKELTRILSE